MKTKKIIGYIFSFLTYFAVIFFVASQTPNSKQGYELYKPYINYIVFGFLWTIFISVVVFLLSFIIGGFMFWLYKRKLPYFKYLVEHFTMFMFGSPMLVVVIVFYFFIGPAFGITDKLFLGILALTLYFAPFMMKLYQSAFESVDERQFIVCDIFGFSNFQMYYYVIFPQMLRIMFPPLSGNLANIIKSTSLLYLIGFKELYYTITNVQSKTLAYTEGYFLMIVLYLIITVPLIKLTYYLEKRYQI